MSRILIEKIITLIKELPENTESEDMEELIYQLYAKREILKGLEDSRKSNVISFDEFKERMDKKWLS